MPLFSRIRGRGSSFAARFSNAQVAWGIGLSSRIRPRLKADKLLQANLCLFAPALFGALVCGWKGVILRSPVLGDLVECYPSKSPAYKQLQASSPILKEIRDETVDFANKFPEVAALRARNLFGTQDTEVSIWSLTTDLGCECEPYQKPRPICLPAGAISARQHRETCTLQNRSMNWIPPVS